MKKTVSLQSNCDVEYTNTIKFDVKLKRDFITVLIINNHHTFLSIR